ncbi:tRNA pseudouridine(55) synthase TruB [Pelagicoccus sp. NFK12]|uniref:tRNA pseudouridine synthase B n=1 Tax=Pelagicoccus enzymogenes TaxID=2773457 RepID=A0A927F8P9_9BACT|nr:tRNA pseudouridine(55) synthase TruB [Pelagicoccus enzymogenes]MBD5779950.1 tRNA pseudouridine(55) synthase TruB [Pelagicoccus enzymogenes]MDQ8200806.1 tRNA pseudouridine(55) synthase TruB [Pelagicoccus enzymogenes]
MEQKRDLEGVLLIDKPTGMTSHDVVDQVRRKLRMKRIGHAGTLDPMATGLLIILVGKATKLSQYLMSLDKTYSGTIKLGESTNTQDADGEITVTKPLPEGLTQLKAQFAMSDFVGDQYQTPPMFSAVKIKGQRLYKLARKGQEVEREPRFIRVSKFEITRFDLPEIDFTLDCSKGTYVRTLANDFGEKLGCGAHLTALRRDASNDFDTSRALPLDTFKEMEISEIEKKLIPAHEAMPENRL